MKQANAIICAFAVLSITALSLWAIHDLWVVLLVLFCIVGGYFLMTSKR